MNVIEKIIELDDNREIIIETGKLAKQANGSVVVKMGNTMLLATAVTAKNGSDVDFMPLSVDYREKFAAGGRIPGGFKKREARPSDSEILVSRLIDRALRPLFPKKYHAETFVNVELISADPDIMPDALAGLAASAALTVSDIPWEGPISECRVARVDGVLVINPTFTQLKSADMDIVVGATLDNILMVEGEMKEASEAEMIEALKLAHEYIKVQCQVQIEMAEQLGVTKIEFEHETHDEELEKAVKEFCYDKVYEVAKQGSAKHERSDAFDKIKEEFIEQYAEKLEEGEEVNEELAGRYYHDVQKEAVRNMMLDEQKRLDGRMFDEIRPIWSEVDYLPMAHGSAVFTRGETQSLSTVTLGTRLDEQMIDEVLVKGVEKFMLHYNFPPYSTGDARPQRGTGRREIGHGNLAHRALKPMMPDPEDNPYTVRVVSDILESNGSSSMATVCAGTLALMDAGVGLKKPVSGIAMGLITREDGKNCVLSDILGDEDHLGDMDFKVTGTRDGITATQMDIKIDGLPYDLLAQALEQARVGRLHILDKIEETMTEPREDYKPHVPRIVNITIPREMIGAVIGPGGKVIQEIQEKTNSIIAIEEVAEEGVGIVNIASKNKEDIDKAVQWVESIVAVPEVGEVYEGKIVSIVAFGAFVQILPGKEGLLHVSEIDYKRVEKVEDVLKEGDIVKVKLIDIDKKTGKLKLSRKALLPRPPKKPFKKKNHGDNPQRPPREEKPE